MEKKRSFVEAVRAVVRDVGRGQVVSYGEVARRAGYPRAARAVGNVLANSLGLPWWRIVRANGELAAHGGEEQARRLRREGVAVRDGRCQVPTYSKARTIRRRS
ncbi:MAG: MGMT family protein [Chloroflexi bacterium]|nr:MAG: MGMT family protein [Chloroflexota bacterium]TMG00053.1 MAG: MGMT family protein [Chloroflexota bacterium]